MITIIILIIFTSVLRYLPLFSRHPGTGRNTEILNYCNVLSKRSGLSDNWHTHCILKPVGEREPMKYKGERILIIDDESHLSWVVKEAVEEFSCEASIAPSAGEGLKMAVQLKPDIIILTLMIPNQDRIELLKQLKQNPESADIPVIVLTGASEEDLGSKSLQEKTSKFLTSELDLKQLIQTLAEMGRRQRYELQRASLPS